GATATNPAITIVGDKGKMTWTMGQNIRFEPHGQASFEIEPDADMRRSMIGRVAKFIRGTPDPDHAVATLEIARAQVVALNAAAEASPIYDIDPARITRTDHDDQEWLVVDGLFEMIKT